MSIKDELLTKYGHINHEQMAEAIDLELTNSALDVLRLPSVTAVTVNLSVAGESWDITVSGGDFHELGEDGTLGDELVGSYWWDARENVDNIDPQDGNDWEPEEVFGGATPAETPQEALAQALAKLAERAQTRAA